MFYQNAYTLGTFCDFLDTLEISINTPGGSRRVAKFWFNIWSDLQFGPEFTSIANEIVNGLSDSRSG